MNLVSLLIDVFARLFVFVVTSTPIWTSYVASSELIGEELVYVDSSASFSDIPFTFFRALGATLTAAVTAGILLKLHYSKNKNADNTLKIVGGMAFLGASAAALDTYLNGLVAGYFLSVNVLLPLSVTTGLAVTFTEYFKKIPHAIVAEISMLPVASKASALNTIYGIVELMSNKENQTDTMFKAAGQKTMAAVQTLNSTLFENPTSSSVLSDAKTILLDIKYIFANAEESEAKLAVHGIEKLLLKIDEVNRVNFPLDPLGNQQMTTKKLDNDKILAGEETAILDSTLEFSKSTEIQEKIQKEFVKEAPELQEAGEKLANEAQELHDLHEKLTQEKIQEDIAKRTQETQEKPKENLAKETKDLQEILELNSKIDSLLPELYFPVQTTNDELLVLIEKINHIIPDGTSLKAISEDANIKAASVNAAEKARELLAKILEVFIRRKKLILTSAKTNDQLEAMVLKIIKQLEPFRPKLDLGDTIEDIQKYYESRKFPSASNNSKTLPSESLPQITSKDQLIQSSSDSLQEQIEAQAALLKDPVNLDTLKESVDIVANITSEISELKAKELVSLKTFFIGTITSMEDIVGKSVSSGDEKEEALVCMKTIYEILILIEKCKKINGITWTDSLNSRVILTEQIFAALGGKLHALLALAGDSVAAQIAALKTILDDVFNGAVKSTLLDPVFISAFKEIDNLLTLKAELLDAEYLLAVDIIHCRNTIAILNDFTCPKAVAVKKAYERKILKVIDPIKRREELEAYLTKTRDLKLKVEDGADKSLSDTIKKYFETIIVSKGNEQYLKEIDVNNIDLSFMPKVAIAIRDGNKEIAAQRKLTDNEGELPIALRLNQNMRELQYAKAAVNELQEKSTPNRDDRIAKIILDLQSNYDSDDNKASMKKKLVEILSQKNNDPLMLSQLEDIVKVLSQEKTSLEEKWKKTKST